MNNPKIPHEIRELSRSRAVSFYELSKLKSADEIKTGQIWSTQSLFQLPDGSTFQTDEPKLIVVLQGKGDLSYKFDQITVAPLSIHTNMACEYDFIIKQDSGHSPLAFDFIIEVWNETPTLKGQLNKYIGSLSDEALENMLQLYFSRVRNLAIVEKLKEYIGTMIVAEDDPRRVFQEEEVVATGYLASAATASLELESEYESQKANVEHTKSWKVIFDVQPYWGTLSTFLRGPIVARAADNSNIETESFLIAWPEKEQKIIFELLKRSQQPYDIYIKTHSVAKDFMDIACIVSVKTKEKIFHSEEIRLNTGIRIEIGKDARFRYEDVEGVELAVESH